MYKIFLTKQTVKECKKRGKKFKEEVKSILSKLSLDPFLPQSEKLSGELNFIYSYHFNFSGTAYRLAYIINEKEKILTVVLIGPRENFYQILRQKLRS